MFTPDQLKTFKEKIDSAQRIAIFGHESVDGDAIGSMLGLGTVLEQIGKHVGYFTTLTPSENFSRLPISKISTVFDYSDERDLIVFVDFNGYRRIAGITAGHETYFDSKERITIDHHIPDGPIAGLNLSDVDASSNCELVYEIISQTRPEKIESVVATYLYLGLVTDTDNFHHGKDTIRTMNNALGLLKHGADKKQILEKVYHNNPIEALDFIKLAAPRITIKSHICYARYTEDEISPLGLDRETADGLLIGIMRSIRDIPALCILRKRGDQVGGSLRSAGKVSVQQIAMSLGGGGHLYAAGFKQPAQADFTAQIDEIIAHVEAGVASQL